jgi:hypothetical protein
MRLIPVVMAVLLEAFGATAGIAQVMQLPRPAPEVTAASADWQLRGDPVFFAGDAYYPTGPNVFFNGFAMVLSGAYRGIPLYTDTSLEPYRIVYVPIGRNAMRPYERRGTGESAVAGTTRASSPPTDLDAPELRPEPAAGIATSTVDRVEANVVPDGRGAVGTRPATTTPSIAGSNRVTSSRRPARPLIQSIPAPRSSAGIWLEFNGAHWYSAGRAVPFAADKFVRIGAYRGLPVYRSASGRSRQIYIPSVADGPLAPYSRH